MQAVTTIGLDIAKSVFQVHGVDAAGQVLIRRQLKRRAVLAFFQKLPVCLVGIEACASSHYWSRELQALGHSVRLMPPAYVKRHLPRAQLVNRPGPRRGSRFHCLLFEGDAQLLDRRAPVRGCCRTLLEVGLFTVHLLNCTCPRALGRRAPVLKVDGRCLAGNDDRQVRDGRPLAIEYQTLGRVSAGGTSKGVPLNAAYRRPIGANVGQAHLSAARQTFHTCPLAPSIHEPTVRPSEVTTYRCGSLLGRASEA